MSQALTDDEPYATTRGEPPLEVEPPTGRTRRPRPTVDDLPPAEAEPRPSPDDAVAAITREKRAAEDRVAAMEREREAWQRERDELTRGKAEAETRGVSAQKQSLLQAISAEDQRISAAEQSWQAARESGDLPAERKAMRETAAAEARKIALERDKVAWDDWEAEQAREAEAVKTRPAPKAPEPAAGGEKLPPEDLAWIEKHPVFKDDEDCEAFIRARAQKVINDGTWRGSPAFYRELDRAYERYNNLRALESSEREPELEPAPPPRRAQPSAASMAPAPSRSNGSDPRGRGIDRDAVLKRAGITLDEARSFAMGRAGGLDGYVKSLATDLGMT